MGRWAAARAGRAARAICVCNNIQTSDDDEERAPPMPRMRMRAALVWWLHFVPARAHARSGSRARVLGCANLALAGAHH